MQVDNISAVSSVTKTYHYVESVQKVVPHQNIEGKDRIMQTNYVVTVYDNSGKISTTTSNHQIDYLI